MFHYLLPANEASETCRPSAAAQQEAHQASVPLLLFPILLFGQALNFSLVAPQPKMLYRSFGGRGGGGGGWRVRGHQTACTHIYLQLTWGNETNNYNHTALFPPLNSNQPGHAYIGQCMYGPPGFMEQTPSQATALWSRLSMLTGVQNLHVHVQRNRL